MEQIFWLLDGQVAGHSGPNRDPWILEEFPEAEFSAILSVNNGESCHTDRIAFSRFRTLAQEEGGASTHG